MKLYKKDSKDRIRVLLITAVKDTVVQESGLLEGKRLKVLDNVPLRILVNLMLQQL